MAITVVLGVPRSGTNLIARILHTRQSFGSDLIPPNDWNPDGWGWDRGLHLALDPFFAGGEPDFPLVANLGPGKVALRNYISGRELRENSFGLHDYRLPFVWVQLVGAVTQTLSLVVIRRPLADCVASWVAIASKPFWAGGAGGTQFTDGATSMLARFQTAIEAIVSAWSGPKLELDLGTVRGDPPGQVKRIGDFAGIALPPEAIKLIKPGGL